METARDPQTVVHWDAISRGALVVQQCQNCNRLRFPPTPSCPACRSFDDSWIELSGRGRILTWARTHHVFNPLWAEEVPYTVILVELEEQHDLVMYGYLAGTPTVLPGMPVRASFVTGPEGVDLINWAVETTPTI